MEPTEATTAKESAAAPSRLPERRGWKSPLLWVVVIALLALTGQWLATRLQISALQEEAARRLAEADALAGEGRLLARQSQETAAALQARVAILEAKLADMQNQSQALEAMYQELADSRDERLLAEVEQAVALAQQQLQFAGNVELALLALDGAQARLARSSRPQFVALRRLLERDSERLRATPGADVPGLSAKIGSVVVAVDVMPLAFEQRPQPAVAKAAAGAGQAKPAGKDWRQTGAALWQEFWQEFWQDVQQLIRIERIDRGDPALLSPSQSFFLRENLKLHLLGARLALLQRDGKTFHEEIRQAQTLLERYFDGRAKAVTNAQLILKGLAATEVSFTQPALSETLATVRNLKLGRERGSRTGR